MQILRILDAIMAEVEQGPHVEADDLVARVLEEVFAVTSHHDFWGKEEFNEDALMILEGFVRMRHQQF